MNHKAGFTLIEVMIAVAIMAILAMIAVARYQSYLERSRNAATQSLLHNLATAQMALKTSPGEEDFLPVNDAVGPGHLSQLAGLGFRPDQQVGFAAIAFDGEDIGAFILFGAYCQPKAQVFVYNFIPNVGVRPYDPAAGYSAILPPTMTAYLWDGTSANETASLILDTTSGQVAGVVKY